MAITFTHVFAFLIGLNSVLSLTCYQCDSSESSLCYFSIATFAFPTTNCSLTNGIPKQCIKIVARHKVGSEYAARGCMPAVGGVCSATAKSLGFFGSVEDNIVDTYCYTCEGDKCNSASRYAGYTFLGVVLAALAFLL